MGSVGSKCKDERDWGAFIPRILDDYGLEPFEFRVYAHIARRANGGGECWEGLQKIALICKMNIKTVRKALSLLIAAGLVRQEIKPGSTNVLTLTNQDNWVKSSELDGLRNKPPTKSGSTKSGTPTKSGSTKSGSTTLPNQVVPPLPNQVVPPLPNQVPKGIPIEGIPIEGIPGKGKIPPTPQVEILENEPKQIELQAELVSVSDLNQHTSSTARSTHEDQFSAVPKNQLEKFNATERFEQQFQLRQRSAQFENWWEGYKRFCFQVDAIPGQVEDALQAWHQKFAQGVPEAFFEGDKAYQYQKRKQFLKRGDAIGVPGGAKYLKNQLWQEALERQREKDAMPDFTPADYRSYEQQQATRRVMSQAMEAIRQKEQQGDKNNAV